MEDHNENEDKDDDNEDDDDDNDGLIFVRKMTVTFKQSGQLTKTT